MNTFAFCIWISAVLAMTAAHFHPHHHSCQYCSATMAKNDRLACCNAGYNREFCCTVYVIPNRPPYTNGGGFLPSLDQITKPLIDGSLLHTQFTQFQSQFLSPFFNQGQQNNPGQYNNQGRQNDPDPYNNQDQGNNPSQFNNQGQPNNPGQFNNQGQPNNLGPFNNQGQQNPGPFSNQGQPNNPGPFNNQGQPNNPGPFNNQGQPNNPGPFNNQGQPNNPGPFNNQGQPNNPGPFNNQGQPNNPGPFNNQGQPNNLGPFNNQGQQNPGSISPDSTVTNEDDPTIDKVVGDGQDYDYSNDEGADEHRVKRSAQREKGDGFWFPEDDLTEIFEGPQPRNFDKPSQSHKKTVDQ